VDTGRRRAGESLQRFDHPQGRQTWRETSTVEGISRRLDILRVDAATRTPRPLLSQRGSRSDGRRLSSRFMTSPLFLLSLFSRCLFFFFASLLAIPLLVSVLSFCWLDSAEHLAHPVFCSFVHLRFGFISFSLLSARAFASVAFGLVFLAFGPAFLVSVVAIS
jgi:hypothetical protein